MSVNRFAGKKVTIVDAEKRLRMRIGRILSLAGLDQTQNSSLLKDVEDQIVELFRAYSRAEESVKDSVYAAGEKRLFRTIRKAEPQSKTSGSLI